MFERSNKSEDYNNTAEPNHAQTGAAGDAPRSMSSSRGSQVAVIGRPIQINGDLRGNEDLRIEGDVSGTVRLDGSALTIGDGGKVKAGVYAKSIAVDGETKGDLHATECVSIHENARVQGNIIAPRVSIVEGAHFKGSIEMDKAVVEEALGTAESKRDKKPVAAKTTGSKVVKTEAAKEISPAAESQAKSA